TECVDEDNDHSCDICGEALTKCADEDNDHSCDICGEALTECVDEDNDTLCEICGESEYLSFTLKNDDTYEISNYKNNPIEIIIPETYKGKNVTSIGDWAFSGCTSLTSLTVSNTASSIGCGSFESCNALTIVTIGNSITNIGDVAFSGCNNLLKVIYTGIIDQWVQIEFCNSSANPLVYGAELYIEDNQLITEVNITTATIVNDYVLQDYDLITSVTIGDSVTSIGCKAFNFCDTLTSVTIGNSVTSIGNEAFSDCYSLTSVTIGDSVTSIGNSAFVNNHSLTSVNYTGSIDQWVQIEFGGSSANPLYHAKNLYINNELVTEASITTATSINHNAFYNCTSLTTLTIGDSVTSIGSCAFVNNHSLTSVNYTGSIDQWVQIEFGGSSANPLYYAKNLYINNELVTEANITTATSINAYAFYRCVSLTSVTIPDSVTNIGDYAFSGCYKLVEVYNLSSLNVTVGSEDNGYVGHYAIDIYTTSDTPSKLSTDENGYIIYTDEDTKILIGYVGEEAEPTLPDDITEIYQLAFYNCDSLTSVVIPDSVTSIGSDAFRGCSSLTSVTISNSVTSIGERAFSNCGSLTNITIGDSVTSVGDCAFSDCDSLMSVYYTGTIDQWVQIEFGNCRVVYTMETMKANPLAYAENLYINNELVTEANITTATCIKDIAFVGYQALTNVTIGDSVTGIGNSAFLDCGSLTSVTIPDSVISIGYMAFSNCDSLISVYYTGTIDQWVQIDYGICDESLILWFEAGSPLSNGANLYINNQLVTEANITTANSINATAFFGCTSLTSVVIGDAVTSIGVGAFAYCPALINVVLPDTLLQVGSAAFNECPNISYNVTGDVAYLGSTINPYLVAVGSVGDSNEITIHKDCKIISYLDALEDGTKVTIPAAVTSIAKCAFLLLEEGEIVVDENNEHYKSINGNLYTKDGTTLLKYVSSVQHIVNTVTKIEDFALKGNLVEIFIPTSIISIGIQMDYLKMTEDVGSTWRVVDSFGFMESIGVSMPELIALGDVASLISLGYLIRFEKI
ncbi:MAG: leucine-rich repeat domain-containing protein, partial [Clostridia bacterium]|nr:leucine-rich repeat domain-containing protein [Clostridia bacterium]